MIVPLIINCRLLIKTTLWRNVHLFTDNRLQPFTHARFVKFNNPVHRAMIRKGNGGHLVFFCALHQRINLWETVEQGIVTMDMKVNEGHKSMLQWTPVP